MDSNEQKQPENHEQGYFDRLQQSVASNRDTQGLGVINLGSFRVGGVDAINGEAGEEIPEFVPTRHELRQLAEYWAKERIECDFDWFVSQCTGSSEWRWSAYINRRINRLAEVLGLEVMRMVWDSAIASFRKCYAKITDEDWRVFSNGTDQEQEEWRDQAHQRKTDALVHLPEPLIDVVEPDPE